MTDFIMLDSKSMVRLNNQFNGDLYHIFMCMYNILYDVL